MHRQDLNHARGFSRTLSEFSAEQSCLQLSFQFSQQSPIPSFRNELVRAGLYHSDFAETQGIESQGALRVVREQLGVRDLSQRLNGVLVVRCETSLRKKFGGALRLGHANLVGL